MAAVPVAHDLPAVHSGELGEVLDFDVWHLRMDELVLLRLELLGHELGLRVGAARLASFRVLHVLSQGFDNRRLGRLNQTVLLKAIFLKTFVGGVSNISFLHSSFSHKGVSSCNFLIVQINSNLFF